MVPTPKIIYDYRRLYKTMIRTAVQLMLRAAKLVLAQWRCPRAGADRSVAGSRGPRAAPWVQNYSVVVGCAAKLCRWA